MPFTLIKAIIKASIIFYLLLISTPVNASCPCFNSAYLHSIFKDHAGLECHVFKRRNKILFIYITDGKERAFAKIGGCEMRVDHHTFSRDYVPPVDLNNRCTHIIKESCYSLKAKFYVRQY